MQNKPTIVFLGTYPPRECGIATFTQDLLRATQKLLGNNTSCKAAAFNLSPLDTYIYPPEVHWKIDQNNKQEIRKLATELNSDSNIAGVIIQHEYGIYGGEDGENILTFMNNCKKTIIVTFHTILPTPSIKMKEVTQKIISKANTVVVLTQSSKRLLEEVYPLSIGKVYVIPHGIHHVRFSSTKGAKNKLNFTGRTVLSTFGLLNRGKGIEYVINALPSVIKKHPRVLYLVLGETHPIVRRNEGEAYRLELSSLVTSLGLKKHVKFYDQYLTLKDLLEFLKATDIYISTTTNPNQAVSGTLSYALGSGRAVVSTEFAQAKEIITNKTGKLVPIKNSAALSRALMELLANKKALKKMHRHAYRITRPMLWCNVACQYSTLLMNSLLPPVKLDYLKKMTDSFGLFQFAKLQTPDKKFGYTLDDNARALVISSKLKLNKYINIYLSFVEKCQQLNGSFINYIGYPDKTPTEQNKNEDLEEPSGRALWAVSEVASNMHLPEKIRNRAKEIFLKSLPHAQNFSHLRARGFVIKSASLVAFAFPELNAQMLKIVRHSASALEQALKNNSSKQWGWFENFLGYNNALLPESLFIAGKILKNKTYLSSAKKSLEFLIGKTFSSNIYIPIGHSQWYKMHEKRSNFDQQPEDPASMILALATAYKITHNDVYRNLASKCFRWFLGNNSLQKPLYNAETGGCFDGLHPDRVNLNQGAESLVSYLLSRLMTEQLESNENPKNKKHIS